MIRRAPNAYKGHTGALRAQGIQIIIDGRGGALKGKIRPYRGIQAFLFTGRQAGSNFSYLHSDGLIAVMPGQAGT